MGVQISKTQSIKIDRLSSSQLIVNYTIIVMKYESKKFIKKYSFLKKVALVSGNKMFNKIFEANLDRNQKLLSNSNM